MLTTFIIGFVFGAMAVALVLLIILDWQDKKDLKNREGRYRCR
jgi:quinol-cytochrome oxidoreductase complex cytochrome b subunit